MKKFLIPILFLFFALPVFADDVVENFDSYTLGDICGQGNWTCSGTYSATVNDDIYRTLDQSVSLDTATQLSNDYIQLAIPESASTTYTWFFWIWVDTNETPDNLASVAFLNDTPTIHTWISIEDDGSVYISGNDTTKDITDSVITKISVEIDEDNNQARIKVDDGTWSGYESYGVTDNKISYIRFYAQTGDLVYFEDIGDVDPPGSDPTSVTIIDYETPTSTISVGYQSFYFPEIVECQISDSNCAINIRYSYNDIGKELYLMEDGETELENYIDRIEELEDKPILEYDLSPTVRASQQIDTYKFFLWDPDDDEGLLYGDTKVYWVTATTSDDGGLLTKFFKVFKRGFPLSLYYDVYDTFYKYQNQATSSRFVLELNDLIVFDEYQVSGTNTIFSAELLEENGGDLWNNRIYQGMIYTGHLITFLYCAFLVWILAHKKS